jgi:rod shape-determining protein MreD
VNLVVWARLWVVLLVALVLQFGAFDQLTVLGAHADVMLTIAVAAGLLGGPQRGAMVGFVAGLLADLIVPTQFGLSALTFTLVAYGTGLVRSIPQGRDSPSADVATIVIGVIVGTIVFAGIGAIAGEAGMFAALGRAVLATGIGALILGTPVLAVLRWTFSGSRAQSTYAVPTGGSAAG